MASILANYDETYQMVKLYKYPRHSEMTLDQWYEFLMQFKNPLAHIDVIK